MKRASLVQRQPSDLWKRREELQHAIRMARRLGGLGPTMRQELGWLEDQVRVLSNLIREEELVGRHSKIGWCDASWNPWVGCDAVSPACDLCYAAAWASRTGRVFYGNVQRTKASTFYAPRRWRGPAVVFVCSLSDFFHEAADEWRAEAWRVIRETRNQGLLYLLLTKRTGAGYLRARMPEGWAVEPWAHVWLGTTVESQPYVSRLEQLMRVPAAGYFVSVEPMLGPVNLLPYLLPKNGRRQELGWVIAGGESTPHCRPTELGWFEDLQRQCERTGTPFYLKQLGGHPDKRAGVAAQLLGRHFTERPLGFPAAECEHTHV